MNTFCQLKNSDSDSKETKSESSDLEREESGKEDQICLEPVLVEDDLTDFYTCEEKLLADFVETECGCKGGPDRGSCNRKITQEALLESRASRLEPSPSELDLLSQIKANTRSTVGKQNKLE